MAVVILVVVDKAVVALASVPVKKTSDDHWRRLWRKVDGELVLAIA